MQQLVGPVRNAKGMRGHPLFGISDSNIKDHWRGLLLFQLRQKLETGRRILLAAYIRQY